MNACSGRLLSYLRAFSPGSSVATFHGISISAPTPVREPRDTVEHAYNHVYLHPNSCIVIGPWSFF